MPGAYGVQPEGFVLKTFTDILEEKRTLAKSIFGEDHDVESTTSPLAQFIETSATEESRIWLLAETIYHSAFVDSSIDSSLDGVGALVGKTRLAAARATGQVTIVGTPAIIIPAGTVVQTDENDPVRFVTDVEATIPGGGSVVVAITAEETGEEGNLAANTLTVLGIPISGVVSVTNAAPTTGGSAKESNEDYRLRITSALEEAGKGTVAAIVNAVASVEGVTDVVHVENLVNHTLALTVAGGDNADILAAIEDTRPAGIAVTHTAATNVNIFVEIEVEHTADAPLDLETQIQEAIVDYIMDNGIGKDVMEDKIRHVVMSLSSEIVQITTLKIDSVDPPVATGNFVISNTQVAISEVANIDVTLTEVEHP